MQTVQNKSKLRLYTTPDTFEAEREFIRLCLNLSLEDLNPENMIKLRMLSGKCYLSQNCCNRDANPQGFVANLIRHLNDVHHVNIHTSYARGQCLFCGAKQAKIEQLVHHIYERHKIVMFGSINKVFYAVKRNKPSSSVVPCPSSSASLNSSSKPTCEYVYQPDSLRNSTSQTIESTLKVVKKEQEKATETFSRNGSNSFLFSVVPKKEPESINTTFDEQQNTRTCLSMEESTGRSHNCEFCNLRCSNGLVYQQHMVEEHMKTCSVSLSKVHLADLLMTDVNGNDNKRRESFRLTCKKLRIS